MAISFNSDIDTLLITDDETGDTVMSFDVGVDGAVELTIYDEGTHTLDEHEVESLKEWLADV